MPVRRSIVHVVTKMELGGAQQTALALARHQARSGHDVRFVTGEEGLLLPAVMQVPGIQVARLRELVHPISPVEDLLCLSALTRLFSGWGPDVVHTHTSKAGILGREAARRAGRARTIHTVYGWSFHAGLPSPVYRLFRALERRAARGTDVLVAVSEAVRETGLAQDVGSEGQYRVIVNAVEMRRFARRDPSPRAAVRKRRALGVPDAGPLVGMVGNLKAQKAPMDFVAACARIAAARPDARFVFVGDGPLRGKVERAAGQAGIADRLVLLGWRDDVEEILPLLSVVLHTSRYEGLPMAVLQAMAAGRPVVATAVDGTVEAVSDGQTGFLVPPGDAEAAAARAVSLLSDPHRARALGAAARLRARRLPGADLPAMLRAYDGVLARLLSA